jgi:hypothetical protein
MTQEVLKKDEYGEYVSCICGNDAITDGFYPCDDIGNEVVPDNNWNGKLYVCGSCGRIIDQDTDKVVGQAIEGAIRL